MGGALLNGWIASGLPHLAVVEPSPAPPLRKLARARKISLFRDVGELRTADFAACVVALKPQVLRHQAERLHGIAQTGTLMLSIAAGTSLASLARAWGANARIVRAMPNTPGAIGRGISALFAPRKIDADERGLAEKLLAGLGEVIWVKSEDAIDVVTAVSGSGPAYVYLLTEALAAAAQAQGMSRDMADKLARATVSGAGAMLDADPRAPALLRRDVTSPGGTTEAALAVLMAPEALTDIIRRAVEAARARAAELRQ